MTEQPPSLGKILAILRRRWLTVVVFAGVTILVTVLALSLWPETYEATATLLVKMGRETTPPATLPGSQSVVTMGKRPEDIASEIEIMQSQYLTEKAVDRAEVRMAERIDPGKIGNIAMGGPS